MPKSPLRSKLYLIDDELVVSEHEKFLVGDILAEHIEFYEISVEKFHIASMNFDAFIVAACDGREFLVKISFDDSIGILRNEYEAANAISESKLHQFAEVPNVYFGARSSVAYFIRELPSSRFSLDNIPFPEFVSSFGEFYNSLLLPLGEYKTNRKIFSLGEYVNSVIPNLNVVIPEHVVESLKKSENFRELSLFFEVSYDAVMKSLRPEWNSCESLTVVDFSRENVFIDNSVEQFSLYDFSSVCYAPPEIPLCIASIVSGMSRKDYEEITGKKDDDLYLFCVGYVFCSLVVKYIVDGYISPVARKSSLINAADIITRNSDVLAKNFPSLRPILNKILLIFNKPLF